MLFKINQRKSALISGWSIIIMALAAIMGMGVVLSPIFEMNQQQFSEQLPSIQQNFWLGIIAWVIILICDVLASWGLYVYYKNVNARKSAIRGFLRLGYSAFLFVAVIQLFKAQGTMDDDAILTYESIMRFQTYWYVGLIVFGFHLLYLSSLTCTSKAFFKVLSFVIAFAGFGYALSNTLGLFILNYESIRPKVEAVFILPMTLGEVTLAIWLVARGGKEAKLKLAQSAS